MRERPFSSISSGPKSRKWRGGVGREERERINHVPFTKIHMPPVANSRLHHTYSAILQLRRTITKQRLTTKKERQIMKQLITTLILALAIVFGLIEQSPLLAQAENTPQHAIYVWRGHGHRASITLQTAEPLA